MVDIAASSAFCNEEDSTTRYMISICVSFNHLKDEPRCPVRIGNDERKQYYIISRQFSGVFTKIRTNRMIPYGVISLKVRRRSPLYHLLEMRI